VGDRGRRADAHDRRGRDRHVRRVVGRVTHRFRVSDPVGVGVGDRDRFTDTVANPVADSDPIADADTVADSGPLADTDRVRRADHGTHCHAGAHAHPDPASHADPDPDSDPDTSADVDPWCRPGRHELAADLDHHPRPGPSGRRPGG
jgi:hypothetical protein